MPKVEGVYQDAKGAWYFKATLGRDPLTGRRVQVTKRGFTTATAAARARRELLESGPTVGAPSALTVDELLDLYLDGLDADDRLSAKTRFDYRNSAASYVRPLLGMRRVRDVTPDVVLAWQRALADGTASRRGKPLAANTVRLARAPLAGAFKLAVSSGLVLRSPLESTPRPKAKRSVPRHWAPEEARTFLVSQEGDRLRPVWAFLLGSGVRIGELVWLRWSNVDLKNGFVRIVDFASTLGYELVPSAGKSRDAVRTIDLDPGLIAVLRKQRAQQSEDRLRCGSDYLESEYVFTKPAGGAFHPQWLSRVLGERSVVAELPRLTAHGLRHTSATLMLANGVPPKVAAERLGHSDPTLFMNLYSHVTPTMQREAAQKIGEALFGE